ncbi:Uncharacterized protein ycf21 [Auxenochlorella protothecoides]|uniref:Uncharacterized protein ycf21 n=1 Tax=Auxenochlorella protothecoides TaxID=3075 RepID=A0A087SQV8_AUXPR|nr:Uncharacterized protein ycf21 [Auxenochlorella protothecoides]KFM28112.1 Uncharacterized protein ycf21 [Auxenochlorella protothecoides]
MLPQGSETEALALGSDPQSLAPPWRLLLLSDGSVTRHLSLLTQSEVNVDCVGMDLHSDADPLPEEAEVMGGGLLLRQVFLRTRRRQALVYARSWWRADSVDGYLTWEGIEVWGGEAIGMGSMSLDKAQPIWTSLSERKTELYREILTVECGHNEELEREFGRPGPFWGRYYIFWHAGQPLTVIQEVFSPGMDEWLGPSSPPVH